MEDSSTDVRRRKVRTTLAGTYGPDDPVFRDMEFLDMITNARYEREPELRPYVDPVNMYKADAPRTDFCDSLRAQGTAYTDMDAAGLSRLQAFLANKPTPPKEEQTRQVRIYSPKVEVPVFVDRAPVTGTERLAATRRREVVPSTKKMAAPEKKAEDESAHPPPPPTPGPGTKPKVELLPLPRQPPPLRKDENVKVHGQVPIATDNDFDPTLFDKLHAALSDIEQQELKSPDELGVYDPGPPAETVPKKPDARRQLLFGDKPPPRLLVAEDLPPPQGLVNPVTPHRNSDPPPDLNYTPEENLKPKGARNSTSVHVGSRPPDIKTNRVVTFGQPPSDKGNPWPYTVSYVPVTPPPEDDDYDPRKITSPADSTPFPTPEKPKESRFKQFFTAGKNG